MSETATAPPAEGGKKKSKTLLIAVIGVALAAGGGGAYWWTHQTPAAAEEIKPDPRSRGVVGFEPFVVNLADPGVSRFLRVNVQLVVATPEEAAELKETPVLQLQARSAILEVLTTQTSDVLVTPEGKAALKEAIKQRVGEAGDVEIIDVLFSDFVVQF